MKFSSFILDMQDYYNVLVENEYPEDFWMVRNFKDHVFHEIVYLVSLYIL